MMTKRSLSIEDIHNIIGLAWCDKTSFEMIEEQTQLSSDEVKQLMKKHLKRSSYTLWRKRVKRNKRKNAKKHDITDFVN